MKKVISVILLMMCFIAAFAKKHKTKKKQKAANNIVSIESFHTACFGRCPIFKVKIDKDGTATYTGIQFVKDSGVYTKNIGAAKAMAIFDRFYAYRADTCRDRYETMMQDLPGTVLTIQYTDKKKVIQNTNLGPVPLRILHSSIDSIYAGKIDNTWSRATDNATPK